MKKSLWSLTVAGLLVLALLPSCAPAAPSHSGEALPLPSVAEVTIYSDMSFRSSL